MVVTFFDGTITTTTTATSLFDISADRHYATWIHTHNMLAIDEIEIKTLVRDQNANVMRVYNTTVLKGIQDDPSFFIPYIPTKQYRVTIRRLAGTDRAFTWQRVEVT
jgi:hypothetical protein